MPLNNALLAEFKYESTNTRKMLECVPSDKLLWRPHEKSMTIGRLATHIAEIPIWIERIMNNKEFNFAVAVLSRASKESTEEIVRLFDERIAMAINVLEPVSDEDLDELYTVRRGENILLTLPRKVNIRNFAFNHVYHHRGQLSVFLRLLNVKVPGMYGPSADEI